MSKGILLVNLGTPDAPTAPALKRYLAEFLGDRRVVDLPRIVWLPILHGIVLRSRPPKSAAKYASIWMEEGSPLRVHTERQAKLLRGLLGHRGQRDVVVDWAMRYGQPSIAAALDRMQAQGVREAVMLPLYPQYSASTTASTEDALAAWRARRTDAMPVRVIREYHVDPGYIAALAASVQEHWAREARADELLMSFHGLPQRAVDRGDPYADQCRATAKALAEALGLTSNQWRITFQSRFGAAKWIQPYTQPSLEEMARAGIASVDVICPGFAADCVETLEEIAMECRHAFLANGGKEFRYIPCLNERQDWIETIARLAGE